MSIFSAHWIYPPRIVLIESFSFYIRLLGHVDIREGAQGVPNHQNVGSKTRNTLIDIFKCHALVARVNKKCYTKKFYMNE